MSFSPPLVSIIGGGLAGSEAAWLLAKNDIPVILYEMRPHKTTGAHHTDYLAELVCSNSFRSDDAETSAVGILHRELDNSHSLILQTARQHAVDAGGALAMDRHLFCPRDHKKTTSPSFDFYPTTRVYPFRSPNPFHDYGNRSLDVPLFS